MFVQLVGELSLSSERFRRLWARHDVQPREGMPTRIHHPHVGDLTFSREKLAIGGAEGQLLVVYHAQSGTSSAEKMALLASLTSPTPMVVRDAIPGRPTVPRPDSHPSPERAGLSRREIAAFLDVPARLNEEVSEVVDLFSDRFRFREDIPPHICLGDGSPSD